MKKFIAILGVIFLTLLGCEDLDYRYLENTGQEINTTEEENVDAGINTTGTEVSTVTCTDEDRDSHSETVETEDFASDSASESDSVEVDTAAVEEDTETVEEDTETEPEPIEEVWACKTSSECYEFQGTGFTPESKAERCAGYLGRVDNTPCDREGCFNTCTNMLTDGVIRVMVRYLSGSTTQCRGGTNEMCEGVEDPNVDTDTEEEDTGTGEEETRTCRFYWDAPLVNRSCVEYLDTDVSTDTIKNIVCASGEYSNEPCPEEGSVGYCHIPESGKTYRYGDGVYDGSAGCEILEGTWVPLN